LEEADGRNDLDNKANPGDASDPFTSTARYFGQFSKPSSVLYSGQSSGITVTNFIPESVGCPSSLVGARSRSQVQGLGMKADFLLPSSGALPTATPTPTPLVAPQTTPGPDDTLTPNPALVPRMFLPVVVR
jgi:hypothetical protein